MIHVPALLAIAGALMLTPVPSQSDYPATPQLVHDSWISRGGLRNSAGEWCCGEGDCFVIPPERIVVTAGGYAIVGATAGADGHSVPVEVIPFSEAQPSPDGAFWRCKRPDGSRRCFFAPPPNT